MRPIQLSDISDSFKLFQYLQEREKYTASLESKITSILQVQTKSNQLTADDFLSIRSALEIGGSAVLSIDGLPGVSGQPQNPIIQRVAALPDPVSTIYSFVVLTGATDSIWALNRDVNPAKWDQIGTIPANMVTTDTTQSITGAKTLVGVPLTLLPSATGAHTADTVGINYEEITLSTVGVTTDSVGLIIPAGAFIREVVYYVSQTVSGGGVSKFRGGDAATNNRFWSDDGNITSPNGAVGVNHLKGSVATDAAGPTNAADAKLRITCDATPTQGKVQVLVAYTKGSFV